MNRVLKSSLSAIGLALAVILATISPSQTAVGRVSLTTSTASALVVRGAINGITGQGVAGVLLAAPHTNVSRNNG